MMVLLAAGAGAGLMFLFDPDRGRGRRAVVRDKAVHATTCTRKAMNTASRDLRNRVRGTVAELRSFVTARPVDDVVLLERVRARIGGVVGYARPLEVEVANGRVTLRGPVLTRDASRLLRRVRAVRGVQTVDDRLDVHDDPAGVPGLQGAPRRPRGGEVLELFQDHWSPAARLVTGITGAVLTGVGFGVRGVSGGAAAMAGMALLTRAALNTPLVRGRNLGRGRARTSAA